MEGIAGLTSLSTDMASREDPFASCYEARNDYSDYGEIFLLRNDHCYMTDSVAFMYVL